jgi:H+/Cl- antiporter ClcA
VPRVARLDSGALVDVTPLWFLPGVFGLYGMTYQRANRLLAEGREESYQKLFGTFGIVGVIGLPPFLLRRWGDRSIVVAVAGTLYWGVLLWLFFAVILPKR